MPSVRTALALCLLIPATTAAGPVDAVGDPLPPAAVARLGTTRLQHNYGVSSLAFAPGGKTLASAGSDAVRLWRVPTGELLLELHPEGGATALAFATDGRTLVTAARGVLRRWDA